MTTQAPLHTTLKYSIAGCSEPSGKYVAENIMVNSPQDQSSRWSGAHQNSVVPQWLLLRLDSVAILKSITFGKFHKRHPCNMKEFKVHIGLTEDNMTQVLHASLKDDASAETFSIQFTTHSGIPLPSRYVRIEPLSAYGQNFHTSIWYVALSGVDDETYVDSVRHDYEESQERSVLRHVLKYLRKRRFLQPFQSVLLRSGLQLEHPSITAIHTALVLQGNFAAAEELLSDLASASLFSNSLLASQPHASWRRILAVDADGDTPSARGGHAMCIDPVNSAIYLFGGWDGQKNLDDFWVYDIRKDDWNLVHYATARDRNGPGPRSCHRMVFDTKSGCIYLLGKLDDAESPTSPRVPSDVQPPHVDTPTSSGAPRSASTSTPFHCAEFFRYHTRGLDAGKWDLLSTDTSASGGPPLIFDHQMCIDSEAQVIYVSGGRVIDGDLSVVKYSGLYSYDIRTGRWKLFQSSDASIHPCIPSRYGHSMTFDVKTQTLFIFGGQRDGHYLSDMYAFHIPTNTVTELFPNFTVAGGPDPCFTQRAVIDEDLREIYLFCGLTHHRESATDTILESDSPYWIYRYERPERPGKWAKILPLDAAPSSRSELAPSTSCVQPVPRYAHQAVYDPSSRTVYMHGGNAALDGEVLMDTREPDDSVHDGDRDRDRHDESSELPVAPSRVDTTGDLPDAPSDPTATHLADFWSMRLVRPPPDDIIRRCRYIIRQQRYREMCAEAPPIKALSYLQTEVSAVVDHTDPEETRLFRSLLSYLLAPPDTSDRGRSDGEEHAPSRLQPPTRDYSPGQASPMKVDTAEKAGESEERTDGAMGEKAEPAHTGDGESHRRPVVSMDEDPIEEEVNGGKPPTAKRYEERTAVFEQLMTFVNEDAKQPDNDLLAMGIE